MVRFKVFVPMKKGKANPNGCYRTHYAKDESEAKRLVSRWNHFQPIVAGMITIIEIDEVSE